MNEQENREYWERLAKTSRKMLLTQINLFIQEAETKLPREDYNKIFRNMRAIQSYLEKKVLGRGGVK